MGNGSIRTTGMGYTSDCVRQRFTGYERDSETGLDYAMARMYANAQGRFTGVDSGIFIVADPQNFNRYSHTQNNPLKFIDPSGKNIELTGSDVQSFVDYLEKNTGLKLKYAVKNGVITITGSTKDKNFKGNVNKAFVDVVSKVAGASGTAKFHVDSSISTNGNQKGEVVFVDDNAVAYNSATLGADGSRTIRPGNINMTSVSSIDSQASELALGLIGHALIEGLNMRERGANYEVGDVGAGTATGAHPDGLEVERKILGQQNRRYQPNTGNTTDAPISFVYTNIQYDIVIKSGGAASVTKVSPPTIKRPQK